MDAAVESLLKAKFFKDDLVNFMKNDWEHLSYDKAIKRMEQQQPIPEIKLLIQAHSERNKAQHRAVIANHSWKSYHLKNIRSFSKRFSKENFNVNLDEILDNIVRLDLSRKKLEKQVKQTNSWFILSEKRMHANLPQ